MQVRIEDTILKKYPETAIGYLVARVVVKKNDPYIDALKQGLLNNLEEKGINATNFAVHPNIAIWRKIYEEDFGVKAKTYRSSVESLLRRVVTGREFWNINNIVDLYNCCSVLSLLPMGGYDMAKISGDLTVRYAKEGETFVGLGEWKGIETKPNHIVYSDDSRVVCWLWNHKDAGATCIDETTECVIFFIDAAEAKPGQIETAVQQLAENLKKIGCVPQESGILNRKDPRAQIM